jgi:hypothetical protein
MAEAIEELKQQNISADFQKSVWPSHFAVVQKKQASGLDKGRGMKVLLAYLSFIHKGTPWP